MPHMDVERDEGDQALKRRLKRTMDIAVNRYARRVLFGGGEDVTEQVAARSCLVLAPHPDDETLGCGVSILRKVDAGTSVRIIFATDGGASHPGARMNPAELVRRREAEAVTACAALGVERSQLVFLGHPDGRLHRCKDELREQVRRVLREFESDEVLVTSGMDWHRDHRALFEVVTELMASEEIRAAVRAYPVWFWSARSWIGAARPGLGTFWRLGNRWHQLHRQRVELVRTDGYLARKRSALEAYATQMRREVDEPEWACFDTHFIANFFQRYEVLFPLRREARSP